MKLVAWFILSCISGTLTLKTMQTLDLSLIKEVATPGSSLHDSPLYTLDIHTIPQKKKKKLINLIKSSSAPLKNSSPKNFLRPTLVVASTLLVATSLYQAFIYSDNSFEKPIKVKELAITTLIAILPLRRLGNIIRHASESPEHSLLQQIQQDLEGSA